MLFFGTGAQLEVHPLFLGHEFLFGLFVIGIGNTAIYRAHGGTLGLFMEARTFGTFLRHYVIDIVADRLLIFVSIKIFTGGGGDISFEVCTIGKLPFYTGFIDGIVGTFWLTSATIDTFIGYNDSHRNSFFGISKL
jgi:hypothetical protein